jgi:hypothetical protein
VKHSGRSWFDQFTNHPAKHEDCNQYHHHIFVQRPFEERSEDDADGDADEAPDEENGHWNVFCPNERWLR